MFYFVIIFIFIIYTKPTDDSFAISVVQNYSQGISRELIKHILNGSITIHDYLLWKIITVPKISSETKSYTCLGILSSWYCVENG